MKIIVMICCLYAGCAAACVSYDWVNVDVDLASGPLAGSIEFSDAAWQAGDFFNNAYYPAFVTNAPIVRLMMGAPGASVDWPLDAGCSDVACAYGAFDIGFGIPNLGNRLGPPNLLVGGMFFSDSDTDFWMESINDDGLWRVHGAGTGVWMRATDAIAQSVPEPSVLALFLAGLIALGWVRRRV